MITVHANGSISTDRGWCIHTPQQARSAAGSVGRLHGRVLMGGLGGGLSACAAARISGVDSVTCVEVREDVAQHAGLSVPECVTVYVGDFWSYMRNCAHRFDSCFVDLADGMSAKHDPGNVEALSSFATVVIVDFDPYLDDFLSGSLVSKVQERGLSIYTWKKGNP